MVWNLITLEIMKRKWILAIWLTFMLMAGILKTYFFNGVIILISISTPLIIFSLILFREGNDELLPMSLPFTRRQLIASKTVALMFTGGALMISYLIAYSNIQGITANGSPPEYVFNKLFLKNILAIFMLIAIYILGKSIKMIYFVVIFCLIGVVLAVITFVNHTTFFEAIYEYLLTPWVGTTMILLLTGISIHYCDKIDVT